MPSAPYEGIRGRPTKISSSAESISSAMPLSSKSSYLTRPLRPRIHSSLPFSTSGDGQYHENKKFSRSNHLISRFAPTSIIIAIIAIAFLILSFFVSRSIDSAVFPPSSTSRLAANKFSNQSTNHADQARVATDSQQTTSQNESPISQDSQHSLNLEESQRKREELVPKGDIIDSKDDNLELRVDLNPVSKDQDAGLPETKPVVEEHVKDVAPPPPPPVTNNQVPSSDGSGKNTLPTSLSGKVDWFRSWPLTAEDDKTGLYPLETALKIDDKTLLDYFHLHKTGGVSVKSMLIQLFNIPENLKQNTTRGRPMRFIETCYQAESPLSNLSVLESDWRCDFRQIREFDSEKLQSYDLVMGHQYWDHGCDYYFGSLRNVKYFSVFRHPLSRKLSFYYHFFVRNMGRNESEVPRDEVLKFVLAEDLPVDARMRDAGPNYYASRFMSNGMSLFKQNQIHFSNTEGDDVISKVKRYIDERFIFVGLQLQNLASNCMLQKTMQVYAHVHGLDTYHGTPLILASQRRILNTGDYSWTPDKLWNSMSTQQKEKFKQVERVDLAIYDKAVQKFKNDVKMFRCEDDVDPDAWQLDVFE